MRASLILAAVLAAGPAFAGDLEAHQGDDSVRFTDQPCPIVDVIADHVPAGNRGYLHLARAHFQGQDFIACWIPSGERVLLYYEDGDAGVVPVQELKPVSEI